MTIEIAKREDAQALADIFIGHITAHTEYISHGEIQMGVGVGEMVDGELKALPAPDAREKWMKYILYHIEEESVAEVWKAVDEGRIVGFVVADIEADGDAPFGMICDILVKEDCRQHGTGAQLLQTAIDWLHGRGIKDIYLESGKNNHPAHRYFEKKGFTKVSEIYKLA